MNRRDTKLLRMTRRLVALWVVAVISMCSATAWASMGSAEPSVAMYTLGAVGMVIAIAVVLTVGLKVARGMRLIGDERSVKLARQLRVAMGAVFLLAAVTPYVAVNFSAATVVPFVAGAGMIVIAWVWGASRDGDMDTEISPPSGV